jgi:membrane protease YdiL (CAAX protease family)
MREEGRRPETSISRAADEVRSETASPPSYPLGRILVLVAAVALLGLLTHLGARALGWKFPSFGYSAGIILWKGGTLATFAFALRRYEGRRIDGSAAGLRGDVRSDERRRRTGKAIIGLLAAGALMFAVSKIPGFTSSGDASAYGTVTRVGPPLFVFELIVRYPITVLSEEAFFRGFLQPRLPWAPPVMSGLLFAAYHLQQAATIPSLIPFGIALGVIRWWTGNIRTTSLLHYAANVAFFVTSYR